MIRRYFRLHIANLLGAAGRLARQPGASLLTTLVIAIALALPAGLNVFVDNATRLTGNWRSVADITVYLEIGSETAEAAELGRKIDARPDVESADFISNDDALSEFRERSGFGEALDALTENPLPHTIIVRPAGGAAADVEALTADLESEALVDQVQLDTEWVARLRGMLALFGRVVDMVTVLLALAVMLVIGNTIRLEINNRSVEIEVMKLVGGTDGFIRRPFLYLGLCYGAAGAVIAAAVITLALFLLRRPVADLAALYSSAFALTGLSIADIGRLVGGGAVLGWAGAWLAAARHLRTIEPA